MESIVLSMFYYLDHKLPLSFLIQNPHYLLRRRLFVSGKPCRTNIFLSSSEAYFSNYWRWTCIHSNLFDIRLTMFDHRTRGCLKSLSLMNVRSRQVDKVVYCWSVVCFHRVTQHLKGAVPFCHSHQRL